MATKLSELPTGQAISKLIDETVTASRTAASTNTVIPVLTLNRQSSGTPATGIGGSLVFNVETAAGNTETGATIEAVTTDVTGTSEDFNIVFKTMAAGATAAERVKINYDGIRVRSFNGSPGYDFGSDNVGGVQAMTLFGGSGTSGMVTLEFEGVVVGSNKGFFSAGGTESNINSRDTGLVRYSAGVWKATNGSTQIRGLLGGGAAVASAAALPLPTGRVFHVTGTTNITSITSTNFASGCVITMIFDDTLTVTHGNNIVLAGGTNFSATANTTLTLSYDGTNWYGPN